MGLEFRDACHWLAERAGISLGDEQRPRKVRRSRRRRRPRIETQPDALYCPERHAQVREYMQRIWAALELSEGARSYLRGRGICDRTAEAMGVRSATPEQWRSMQRDAYRAGESELWRDAGLDGAHPAGVYRRGAWLVLPYSHPLGGLSRLRFRRIFAGESPKTLCPRSTPYTRSARTPRPYGLKVSNARYSSASLKAAGRPLYVLEGSLDALAVMSCGRPAVASWTASVWRDKWCCEFTTAPCTIVLADGDEAGREFARRVLESARRMGERRVIGLAMPDGADAVALAERGELESYLSEVETQHAPMGAGGLR